jgi:group I intron endonuclease
MDDTYVIYKHTSPSGKSYIGQTKHYDKRCYEHQTTSNCRALHLAIKKYGWDNFQHEILIVGLSLDEANRWEEVLIKELNTLAPNGYNLTAGGRNSLLSEETKLKMSISSTGNKHSDESKRKMSESKQRMSDETKAKMSKSKRNMSEETKAKCSTAKRNMSEETKAKMSMSKLGKKRGPYKKKSDL